MNEPYDDYDVSSAENALSDGWLTHTDPDTYPRTYIGPVSE